MSVYIYINRQFNWQYIGAPIMTEEHYTKRLEIINWICSLNSNETIAISILDKYNEDWQ